MTCQAYADGLAVQAQRRFEDEMAKQQREAGR